MIATREHHKGELTMKLSTLRYFIAIAQYGSFTKAAERLLISQPTLSRQILELEEELGTQLFIRDKKSLRLTEDGELLLGEASAIIDRCDRLPALFRPAEAGGKGKKVPNVLKIGYQVFFDTGKVYQAMADIRRDDPQADVLLLQGNITELKQGLKSNLFDAVFSLQIYFEGMPGVRVLPFRENRLQLVVPAGHPLAGREKVKIADLSEENFILIHREYSPIILDQVISLCVKNGFSPNASRYVSSGEEGLELVAAGKGISFLHSQMRLEGLNKRFNVKFLDIDEAEAELAFALIYKEQNQKRILQRLISALDLEQPVQYLRPRRQ